MHGLVRACSRGNPRAHLAPIETPFRRPPDPVPSAAVLTPQQRKWFLLEQILVPALFNLGFNAALGWVTFRAHVPVPLSPPPTWLRGDPSIGGDVLGMLFFLPAFTCVIATPLIKRAARIGKIERLPITPSEHWLLRNLPRSMWWRAGYIGLVCVVLFGPASIGLLALLGLHDWALESAVWFKGAYAAVLAMLVQPPIAAYALTQDDQAPAPQPSPQ